MWTLPQRNAERGETVQGVQGQEFRNHRNLFRPEAGTLEKAVKELKMTWPQACDFQVWYGPVARKYNLSAVPYTVLINPEGKVEALDLRGEELINTIKNLVKGNKKK